MELFLSAFVTLLVIVDPLGTAAVYGALTGPATREEAHAIARKATLIATGVLLFFGLFGAMLIAQLGISLEAFRIAGGILLFVIAFRMLMGHHDQHNIQDDKSVYSMPAKAKGEIAVFPLAIPLLSGPGCMTAMILLTNSSPSWNDRAMVFVAMLLTMLIAYACMLGVGRVMKIFGEGGIQIVARLMGILLAALAIQFIADGVKALGFLG
jgi:multiple antibiotic resistance protein